MVLVADSGSTKTDWMIGGRVFSSPGINPVMMEGDAILSHIPSFQQEKVTEVFFYGAGCVKPFSERVEKALRQVFPKIPIHVESDLLGAARALCGHQPGIACILGTGSNTCLYDGQEIIDNIPPLGYILGDEGSGAVLGKLFLNKLFKRELPEALCDAFRQWTPLTYTDILDKVYRQPSANRFLASLSPFICQHVDEPVVNVMVYEHFNTFVRKNVMRYHRPDLPVSLVGGIAEHYRDILVNVLRANDLLVGEIIPHPIMRLTAYHSGAEEELTGSGRKDSPVM